MTERIGIIGTGRMGTAFAKRLIETGHQVAVWNRTAEHTSNAAEAGATVADTPADLAAIADVIITSLTDRGALDAVLDELALTDLSGKLVIEMSTLLPSDEEEVAARIRGAGAGFVDCPVGGTVGPALKGALLGLAGGEAADFERAEPVLEHLCKRVERLGPAGAGARMKLAVNLPLAVYWATLAESLTLLKDAGLSGETIASLLADSSAGPNVLKNRMAVVAQTIDGADQPGTFDIDGLAKDLALALEWGRRTGATMPVASAVGPLYSAAQAKGLGGCDGASLARFASGS
jgi:3-hydroxyisobutyrate dehydrogenase